MEDILIGTTDRTTTFFIPDPASTDGSGKTGLTHADLTVSYTRVETDNDVVVTDVTSSLSTLTNLTDSHADWGVKEVSSTLAPGVYRVDVADAVFASGAWEAIVYVMITSSAASAAPKKYRLVSRNDLDAVRLGLTALPNAAAEASGGLYTRGTGAGQINQSNNGQIDVDAKRTGGTTNTGRDIGASVLLSSGTGTGQLDFTGGVVKSSLVAILGTALTETSGQIAAAFKKFFDKASPTGTINSLPDAVAGATGGLFIAGSNAATTVATWTCSGASTITGQAVYSDGIVITCSTSGRTAFSSTGNGTGHGAAFTSGSGATGDGARFVAASTNGAGLRGTGAGTGTGLFGQGGATDGSAGISGTTGATNGYGIRGLGGGTGSGLYAVGGGTGSGVLFVGGSTSGAGVRVTTTDGHGVDIDATGTDRDGIVVDGGTGTGVDIRGDITGNVTGNLSGSVGSVTAGVSLANAAITSATYDASTAFPLTSADSSTTRVARTGADSDTLETLSDQIDGVSGGSSPNLLLDTTVATVTSQTILVLTAGSSVNDAYNSPQPCTVVLYDASNSNFPSLTTAADYVGSTKTLTLSQAANFTVVSSDGIKIFVTPPGTTAPTAAEVRTEMDNNSTKLAAIVADTNELQTDWANGGRLDTLLDGIPLAVFDKFVADGGTLDDAYAGSQLEADVGGVPAAVAAETSVAAGLATINRLDRASKAIALGTVGSGSTTTSIVTSSLSPSPTVADQYKGRIVLFASDTTTAALRGQATEITASSSGGVLTVTALTTAPTSGNTFVIQ